MIIPVGKMANPTANTNPINCHAPWLKFVMFVSLFLRYRPWIKEWSTADKIALNMQAQNPGIIKWDVALLLSTTPSEFNHLFNGVWAKLEINPTLDPIAIAAPGFQLTSVELLNAIAPYNYY